MIWYWRVTVQSNISSNVKSPTFFYWHHWTRLNFPCSKWPHSKWTMFEFVSHERSLSKLFSSISIFRICWLIVRYENHFMAYRSLQNTLEVWKFLRKCLSYGYLIRTNKLSISNWQILKFKLFWASSVTRNIIVPEEIKKCVKL